MIAVMNLAWYDVHYLHWIVALGIPFLMVVVTVIYLSISQYTLASSRPFLSYGNQEIAKLEGFGMDLLPALSEIFRQMNQPRLMDAHDSMIRDSKQLHQERWLPDPAQQFSMEKIFAKPLRNSLSLRPAAAIISSGLLCSVIGALLQLQLQVNDTGTAAALIWIPAVIALAAGILLAVQAKSVTTTLSRDLQQLCLNIGRHLPVFNEQAGMALMIDQMMRHDSKMDATLVDFNQTVQRLAESDMAEGIRRSVEQVLLESVAPPIQQSAATLSDLAVELSKRQEQGMQDLADRFSSAVTTEISRHLGPVNQELSKMTTLMSDVKNYIDYAMKALEMTRMQSEALLNDTRDSMQVIAQAREDLSDDFAVFSEQLRFLGQTNERMANMQSGHETTLTGILQELNDRLEQHSGQLASALTESGQSLVLAGKLTETQKQASSDVLGMMQKQQEELARISQIIQTQIEQFTHSSDQYVKQTLQAFDQGLAEFVERLSFTAVEIRDAVDALPGALRQRPDFNS